MSPNEEEILTDEAASKTQEARQQAENETALFQTAADYQPETPAETIRKSGLAYSAALALVGSVLFMLFLGWLLDSFLGTSPWCLLGGIVVGAAIGFYQFFRLTSQILKS